MSKNSISPVKWPVSNILSLRNYTDETNFLSIDLKRWQEILFKSYSDTNFLPPPTNLSALIVEELHFEQIEEESGKFRNFACDHREQQSVQLNSHLLHRSLAE